MELKFKKIIYISLTIFLGFLVSIIFHSLLEIYIIVKTSFPEPNSLLGHACFLPTYLNIAISFFGLIGGFFLGKYWYNKVYEKK
jgi:hypothetical protein